MTEQDLQFEAEYAEESKKEMEEFFDHWLLNAIEVMDKDRKYIEEQENETSR